jgi:hypothetical protein
VHRGMDPRSRVSQWSLLYSSRGPKESSAPPLPTHARAAANQPGPPKILCTQATVSRLYRCHALPMPAHRPSCCPAPFFHCTLSPPSRRASSLSPLLSPTPTPLCLPACPLRRSCGTATSQMMPAGGSAGLRPASPRSHERQSQRPPVIMMTHHASGHVHFMCNHTPHAPAAPPAGG